MYKVFINNSPIILTDSFQNQNEFPFLIYKNVVPDEIIYKLSKNVFNGIYLYDMDLEPCWKDFKSHFKVIIAGGGLVQNSKKETLFIYRGNKWDLPKGKVEKGESVEKTALREVKEECGIANLILKEFIITTYHIFYYDNVLSLKETHWFLMYTDHSKTQPQLDEGITIAEFKPKSEVDLALKNSYANIQLIFNYLTK
ncbi:MAG: NUDIX domain-containing protein [Flavobacteriaceae bacterium]|nr:MAG: NUDIX domain-containing protein [Flavobacteriaceae bacterium]